MKWDKIKNFLIVMLVLVNLFFGVTLYLQYRQTNYISGTDLQRLSQLLSGSVELPAGVLPAKKQNPTYYVGSYPEDYFETTAYLLSGGAKSVSYVTPNGINFVVGEGSTDTYEFTYPFGFRYVYKANDAAGIVEIDPDYTAKLPDTDFINAFYTEQAIKKFLYADGALNGSDVAGGLRIKLKCGEVYFDSAKNLYITTVAQYVGSQPIYGCEAVVAVRDGKVVYVDGNLILCNLEVSSSEELLDQVNLILLENRDLSQQSADSDGSAAETDYGDGDDLVQAGDTAQGSADTAGIPDASAETDAGIPDADGTSGTEEKYMLTSAESCLCIWWNAADRSKFFLLPGWKFVYNGSVVRIRDAVYGNIYTK